MRGTLPAPPSHPFRSQPMDPIPTRVPVRPCILGILLTGVSAATAQQNPLEAPIPKRGEGGVTAPAAADARIVVPDFIKPGVRLIYEGGSSTENDDPSKPNSAGVGLTRFDVVAVTDTQVLVSVGTFLQAQGGNGYTFGGSSSLAIGDFEIRSGGALWIPTDVLEAFTTAAPLEVTTGPFELAGRRYDTKTLTRITPQSAMRQVFDRGTGLKLSEQSGVGNPRRAGDLTGFNRKITSYSIYQTYRVKKLPWLEAAPPAWVAGLGSMSYRGSQTLQMPGSAPISVPFEISLRVNARGERHVEFAQTIRMQGAQPTETVAYVGSGSTGGNWMNVDVLRKMEPGLVDQDELLGTRLEYSQQEGPKGRLGVLVETGSAHRLVWGYSLEDGALVYSRWDQPEFHQAIEVELVERN